MKMFTKSSLTIMLLLWWIGSVLLEILSPACSAGMGVVGIVIGAIFRAIYSIKLHISFREFVKSLVVIFIVGSITNLVIYGECSGLALFRYSTYGCSDKSVIASFKGNYIFIFMGYMIGFYSIKYIKR